MMIREYVVDMVFCLDILFNFLKRSNAYPTLYKIAINYLK